MFAGSADAGPLATLMFLQPRAQTTQHHSQPSLGAFCAEIRPQRPNPRHQLLAQPNPSTSQAARTIAAMSPLSPGLPARLQPRLPTSGRQPPAPFQSTRRGPSSQVTARPPSQPVPAPEQHQRNTPRPLTRRQGRGNSRGGRNRHPTHHPADNFHRPTLPTSPPSRGVPRSRSRAARLVCPNPPHDGSHLSV